MASAAAVGNVDAIHDFSGLDDRATDVCFQDRFGSPLLTAAATGKTEALRALLKLADKEIKATESHADTGLPY
jgi:hypothetical protein